MTRGTWESDGAQAHAVQRPDGQWYLRLPDRTDTWPGLIESIARDTGGPLVTTEPEASDRESALRACGMVPRRRSRRWTIPVPPRGMRTGALPEPAEPSHHTLISLADADLVRVADLDNALRAEIPGTVGWRGTAADLDDDMSTDAFDPALYLVARDDRTGAYDGLVRAWHNPDGPRLGCIGVRPQWRGPRLTVALLAAVGHVLADRGYEAVTAETDEENLPAVRLARRLGAHPGPVDVEWFRR